MAGRRAAIRGGRKIAKELSVLCERLDRLLN
jgi:hypothetical protein